MTAQASKPMQSRWELLRLVLRSGRRPFHTVAIMLAISPPLLAATFATGPDHWELFERSGALTTTIGFLLASRRYLHRGIIELAISEGSGSRADMRELVEDIHATKLGMAVSAFGTIIWGWGEILQWWTFACLIIWAAAAAFDVRRDFVRLRDNPVGVLPAE